MLVHQSRLLPWCAACYRTSHCILLFQKQRYRRGISKEKCWMNLKTLSVSSMQMKKKRVLSGQHWRLCGDAVGFQSLEIFRIFCFSRGLDYTTSKDHFQPLGVCEKWNKSDTSPWQASQNQLQAVQEQLGQRKLYTFQFAGFATSIWVFLF